MQFIDEATIELKAGKGGDGCVSFLRERNRPKGGPDGGNGGSGGAIYLRGQAGLNTLIDYRFQRHFRAQSGGQGEGGQRTGHNGEATYLQVPVGTRAHNADTNQLLGEILAPDQVLLVARGGGAGRGNMTFASSTNRTPYMHTKGEWGEALRLHLELQLLADIGLVGMPNAGKSSLIRQLSAAKPRVANYPFTTLAPQLGVMRQHGVEAVIADIPGLIEGSAQGKGLGSRFLRHVNRTRLLWHVVDMCPSSDNPIHNFRTIEKEIQQSHIHQLAAKPFWVVCNKIDLLDEPHIGHIQSAFRQALGADVPVYYVSAATGKGCKELAQDALTYIQKLMSKDQQA